MAGRPLRWKTGVEIELIAPRGLSRADLARAMAKRSGGTVRRIFYPQAEPSVVPGKPVFESLTLGFRALDADGSRLGDFVDDLTLLDDLDREAAPRPGWYRIAGDDGRLLRLLARHCDPEAPLAVVLDPAAALFGGEITVQGQMHRLLDSGGHPICIATTLPGERERPTEIITPPYTERHEERLARLLETARQLGFSVPAEGAIHLHYDGALLMSARCMQRLIRVFHAKRERLRTLFKPNPRCRRLGPWSDRLVQAVEAEDFAALPWPQAKRRLMEAGAEKFCDFNIVNLLVARPEKTTFEVRILPVSFDAAEIVAKAAVIERLLDWVVGNDKRIPRI